MYSLNQVGERTYYIDAPTNIGVFVADKGVWLIDSGGDSTAAKYALELIENRGWTVEAVLHTHSHSDHSGGAAYLREKTGCRVYAPRTEAAVISNPVVQPTYLYGGYPIGEMRCKFLMSPQCECSAITEEELPEGLEIMPVGGHSIEMIAVKTCDGVWFLADSLLSAQTLDRYKISFLYDIAEHLKTLEKLTRIDGRLFIPSHCEPLENISELIDKNRDAVHEVISVIKRECVSGLSADEVIERMFAIFGIKPYLMQYSLIGFTTRSYLAYLTGTGELKPRFEGTKLIWVTQ